MTVRDPRPHHIVGAMLLASSWFTLVLFIALDVLGLDPLPHGSVDGMLGIPGLFRVAGWALWCIGGTWAAAVGLLVDLAFTAVVLADFRTDSKEDLLLAGLVAAGAIPAWWSLRGRRWSAALGMVSALAALLAWPLVQHHQHVGMGLISASVLFSVLADGAIAVWALRTWREQTLDPDRDFA